MWDKFQISPKQINAELPTCNKPHLIHERFQFCNMPTHNGHEGQMWDFKPSKSRINTELPTCK